MADKFCFEEGASINRAPLLCGMNYDVNVITRIHDSLTFLGAT